MQFYLQHYETVPFLYIASSINDIFSQVLPLESWRYTITMFWLFIIPGASEGPLFGHIMCQFATRGSKEFEIAARQVFQVEELSFRVSTWWCKAQS